MIAMQIASAWRTLCVANETSGVVSVKRLGSLNFNFIILPSGHSITAFVRFGAINLQIFGFTQRTQKPKKKRTQRQSCTHTPPVNVVKWPFRLKIKIETSTRSESQIISNFLSARRFWVVIRGCFDERKWAEMGRMPQLGRFPVQLTRNYWRFLWRKFSIIPNTLKPSKLLESQINAKFFLFWINKTLSLGCRSPSLSTYLPLISLQKAIVFRFPCYQRYSMRNLRLGPPENNKKKNRLACLFFCARLGAIDDHTHQSHWLSLPSPRVIDLKNVISRFSDGSAFQDRTNFASMLPVRRANKML